MREIKFRAWNGKEIYQCEAIHLPIDKSIDNILWPEKECEVMQFTGLTDKAGVEIYEGDIVKAKHEDGSYDTGEVVYGSKGAFCLNLPKAATGIKTPLLNYIHGIMFAEYDFEVIGNIYENQELLNDTD